MLLLIDNYDSFTHNLARYFAELGQQVKVVRNDQLSLEDIAGMEPQYLVFSPGPCTPDQAGITLSAIELFAGQIPILGVCLGYQAIGQVFGAEVVRARKVMHGKTSQVYHGNSALFNDVSNPFTATRYHSLVLEEATIPEEFVISAWTQEQGHREAIMAIEHNALPLCGVQFHPESVLTDAGHRILGNFLRNY
ncbi:anthranilate synthase component II [Lacimicrobium alkaliphilum]|uniref:Glutamine amidotransferase n=1 Tax=Lacimicrobium alkaliphilum TaxID=1526571 RepID=A0ABQ1RMM4_9ALTE|nr:aminodeoxychorismate/anthranilate synthase component II [Lacimicrobium alkaliphilum]GGD73336.1 glutamine amidotransferase [Lacimicrobium alkaliphilum]